MIRIVVVRLGGALEGLIGSRTIYVVARQLDGHIFGGGCKQALKTLEAFDGACRPNCPRVQDADGDVWIIRISYELVSNAPRMSPANGAALWRGSVWHEADPGLELVLDVNWVRLVEHHPWSLLLCIAIDGLVSHLALA